MRFLSTAVPVVLVLGLSGCSGCDDESTRPSTRTRSSSGSVTTPVNNPSDQALGAAVGATAAAITARQRACVAEGSLHLFDPDINCPRLALNIDGGRNVEFEANARFQGTDSQLRMSRDGRLLQKTLFVANQDPGYARVYHAALCMERAVGEVAAGDGHLIARQHPIDQGQLSPACSTRTLVTDVVGGRPLWHLGGQWSDYYLARVAARCLSIIRDIHALGIVHGDVHAGNFVVDNQLGDWPSRIRVVDFGRSVAFVDAQGDHVPPGPPEGGQAWNPLFLSPWELQGSRLSRRDDVYRLSEALLALRDKGPLARRVAPREGWLAVKDRRQAGPKLLADFHDAMRRLGFNQRPDYEGWIQRFERAAVSDSLNN